MDNLFGFAGGGEDGELATTEADESEVE